MRAALDGGSWISSSPISRCRASEGREALALMKDMGLDLPFIIVSERLERRPRSSRCARARRTSSSRASWTPAPGDRARAPEAELRRKQLAERRRAEAERAQAEAERDRSSSTAAGVRCATRSCRSPRRAQDAAHALNLEIQSLQRIAHAAS